MDPNNSPNSSSLSVIALNYDCLDSETKICQEVQKTEKNCQEVQKTEQNCQEIQKTEKNCQEVLLLSTIVSTPKITMQEQLLSSGTVPKMETESQSSEIQKNGLCTNILNKEDYRDTKKLVTLTDDSEDSDSDSSESAPDTKSSDSSSESDEEANSSTSRSKNPRNKNQVANKQIYEDFGNLPPIENLHISVEEVRCEPVGEISWFVEQIIVVKPKAGVPTLNLDTMLFIERGKRALGRIFDVFGQVSEPYYCVRFNNPEQIKEYGIKQGMTVYFCPNSEYTSLIFMSELVKLKGLDGYDHPDEHPEFSDDEEERAYYASLKKKSNNKKNPRPDVPNKRHKPETNTFRTPNPWNNYPQHSYNAYVSPFVNNSYFYRNRRNDVPRPHQYYNWVPEFNAFTNQQMVFQQNFLPYYGPQNPTPQPPP